MSDEVEQLLASGHSQAQIARELNLAKSTVAYHVRRLGLRADPRFARRHNWNAVQRAIDDEELSMTAYIGRFGFSKETWYAAVRRGDIRPREWVMPIEDLLVVGRKTNRSHL